MPSIQDQARWAGVVSKTCLVICLLLSLTAMPGLLSQAYPTPAVGHQVAATKRTGSPRAAVRQVTGGGIASVLGTASITYAWFHPRLRDSITTISGEFGQRFVATRLQAGYLWRVVLNKAGGARTTGVVAVSQHAGDFTVVPVPGLRGGDVRWKLRAGRFHWVGSGRAGAERANGDAIGVSRSPLAIAGLLALLIMTGAVFASPQAVRLLTRAILLLIGPLLVVGALKDASRASIAAAAISHDSSGESVAVLIMIAALAAGLILGLVGYRGTGRLYLRGSVLTPGLTRLLGAVLLACVGLLVSETVGALIAAIGPGAIM